MVPDCGNGDPENHFANEFSTIIQISLKVGLLQGEGMALSSFVRNFMLFNAMIN